VPRGVQLLEIFIKVLHALVQLVEYEGRIKYWQRYEPAVVSQTVYNLKLPKRPKCKLPERNPLGYIHGPGTPSFIHNLLQPALPAVQRVNIRSNGIL
jgi:hypothetical protein